MDHRSCKSACHIHHGVPLQIHIKIYSFELRNNIAALISNTEFRHNLHPFMNMECVESGIELKDVPNKQ